MTTGTAAPHQPWVAGRREGGEESFEVRSPYDGSLVGRVAVTTPEQVERAVAAAVTAAPRLLTLTAAARAASLFHVSARLVERAGEVAELIGAESGKPVRWARTEVARVGGDGVVVSRLGGGSASVSCRRAGSDSPFSAAC